MPGHDIIVVGASAGGVEALTRLVRDIPPDIPAAIFVVLHIPAQSPSLMPDILSRAGHLKASHPADREKIVSGNLYIAPPDHHLLLDKGFMRVVKGPKENRHRPAIDPTMRSAALYYGPRVIGVVLTGALDDGTAGLNTIKQRGGVTVVQDPVDAMYSSMPTSAIHYVDVDHVAPLSEIGSLLANLAREPAADAQRNPVAPDLEKEVKIVGMDMNLLNASEHPGNPSAYSCPECGGVLWELDDGAVLRFRCRTGHAFSPESVLAEQSEVLERALWAALKTMEEKISLWRQLAQRAEQRGQDWLMRDLTDRLEETEQHTAVLRKLLLDNHTHVENARMNGTGRE